MPLLNIDPKIVQQIADLTLMGAFRSYGYAKSGTAAADTLLGDVNYYNSEDKLEGGAGDDVLLGGAGNDWLVGGEGKDVLSGGSGYDVASYIDSPDAVWIDLIYQQGPQSKTDGDENNPVVADSVGDVLTEIEQINGSLYNDYIRADYADNKLYGYDGDDRLDAIGGNDVVHGMEGNDQVWGGTGNDYLYGEAGNDVIMGGSGNDFLYGGAGNDTLWGVGEGVYLTADGETNHIYGGDGNDKIYGGFETDYLYGEDGIDKIKGDYGNDTIVGGAGDDVLEGEDGNDTVMGGDDQDTVYGNAGDDHLYGGAGNDTLLGGEGVDTYHWGSGNDQLYGDAKTLKTADIFQFSVFGDNGDDTVFSFDTAKDVLQLVGLDKNEEGVLVTHTSDGWLKLEFEGGGSATFVGNADLMSVNSMAGLNNAMNVQYDNALA